MKTPLSNEDAQDLLEKLSNGKPKPGAWFIATRDFSTGGFMWFRSRSALLECVASALPSLEADEIDEAFTKNFNNYQNLVAAISNSGTDFTSLISFHNEHFSIDIELLWIGLFEELLSGDSKFADFIREEFHESAHAIEKGELSDFSEFLGDDLPNMGLFELE